MRFARALRRPRSILRPDSPWTTLGLVVPALVLASATAGCRRGTGVTAQDLLARAPEQLQEHEGRVEVDERIGYGPRAVGAWMREPVQAGGRWLLDARDRRAGVRLQAGAPRDQRIVLELAAPPMREPREKPLPARVYLNGVQIGELELGEELQTFTLAALAPAWVAGENLLEVEVPRLTAAGAMPLGFRMGSVAYGQPRRVVREPGRLELPTDTAVAWCLEPLAVGELALAASARGIGTLLVELAELDPATGARSVAPLEARELLFDADAPRAELRLEVGPAVGPLELRLRFAGEDEAIATVEELAWTATRSEPPPSVLWIALDTLAADHLDLYGYPRTTAPQLAEFARDAVVFERCWTNAPWTLPSFFCSLSGLYASAHDLDVDDEGRRSISMWERRQLAPNRWTLAEALRAGGWQTGAFVDHVWLVESYGIDQGFEHFDTDAAWIHNKDREQGFSATSAAFLAWHDALPDGAPFFALVHGFDIHGPYASVPAFRERVRGVDTSVSLPETVASGGVTDAYDVAPRYVTEFHLPLGSAPERIDPRPLVDAYDGGIAEVDEKLGAFFDELDARGVLDTTWVVVFSDHGESMVQHHRLFGHGSLGEPIAHVPLVVRPPGGVRGGRRVSDRVQLVDLAPTFLELTGLSPEGRGLHGRSLAPLLDGSSLEPVPALCEGGGLDQQAIVLGDWKLVRENPHEGLPSMRLTYPWLDPDWRAEHAPELLTRGLTEDLLTSIAERFGGMKPLDDALLAQLSTRYVRLYDLASDPLELTDLAGERPAKVAELEALLDAELARAAEARARATVVTEPAPMDDTQIEALRAVGYLESD